MMVLVMAMMTMMAMRWMMDIMILSMDDYNKVDYVCHVLKVTSTLNELFRAISRT